MEENLKSPGQLAGRTGKAVVLEGLGVLRKQIWYVLLVFVLTTVSVAYWTFRQPRIYEAAASIIIDVRPPQVLSKVSEVVELGAGSFWSNREYYETQYKIISSRAIAQKVVDKLQLAKDEAFLGLDRIDDPSLRAEALERADAVATLRGGLRVEPVHESRIVRIIFSHTRPSLAQKVVNALARTYRDANVEYRSDTTYDATEELRSQFFDLKRKLEEAEERLATFKRESGVVGDTLSLQLEDILRRQQDLNGELSKLTSQRERLEARLKRIRELDLDRDWGSLEEVLTSKLMAELKASYLELEQERIRLSVDFLERHPKMKTVEQQIDLVEKTTKREVQFIVAGLERKLSGLREAEASHRQRLVALRQEAQRLDSQGLAFDRLQRSVEQNRKLYGLVLERLSETRLTREIETNNIRILDLALEPLVPVRPRRTVNLGLGVLFGLLGGIGLAFLLEYIDRSVSTREEIEEMGLPFLGIAPEVPGAQKGRKGKTDLHIVKMPRSPAAEAARLVHTNLVFAGSGGELRRLVVTSASPQEGKTATAVNIAITMAASEKRTLLVDTDMRRPRLHRVFGVTNRAGVSNLIVGRGELSDCVVSTEVELLDFLPCGPIPPNPAELLQSDAFGTLLDELSSKYDRVILDSPPVMAVADPLILSRRADGVVLVVRAGESDGDVVFRSVQALQDVKAKLLGAVLNGVDLSRPSYGRYHYYYRRGKGYAYSPSEGEGEGEGEEQETP